MWWRKIAEVAGMIGAAGLVALTVLVASYPELLELWLAGDARELRPRPAARTGGRSERPGLLILALDGVGHEVLDTMLRRGELPGLSLLLGGRRDGSHPHAHFASAIAVLPSSTIPGWSAIFSGESPAASGIAGNEFFVRERARIEAPIPMSFEDASRALSTYSDGYVNDLIHGNTVYERLRSDEPEIRIWVSMNQVYRGADRLLFANRAVLAQAFVAMIEEILGLESARAVFAEIDEEVVENLLDELSVGVPEVMTLYLSGVDHFAHEADERGAHAAQRTYLREVLDPLFEKLYHALVRYRAYEDRYVVVLSDHGHVDLRRSGSIPALTEHPPTSTVLQSIGFRASGQTRDIREDDDQAVVTHQGGMAFVYLADRSTCPTAENRCDWSRPPRFEAEVLPVAEAFFRADAYGEHAPLLRGKLGMVLARKPRPHAEDDREFQVYAGNGELVPIPDYLRAHPHPEWIAFAERLEHLAVGRFGDRAGDVLLIPHLGEAPEDRYYFARPHGSGHGGPSRREGKTVLIVAHPKRSREELAALVRETIGDSPHLHEIAPLLLRLRKRAP